MLTLSLCSESGDFVQTQETERLQEILKNGSHRIWVDLDEPTEEELRLLESVFQFHPLAMADVRQRSGFPKIDVYDHYAFLVLHRLFYHFETETCERREFEVFFSDRFLVTIHLAHLSRTFATARELVRQNPKETLGQGTSQVLFRLLELTIEDYHPVMEEWLETLEEIEQRVLAGKEDSILDRILQFRKLVTTMRKNLVPEREVLRHLSDRAHLPFITPEARPYFKNVIDSMNALLHELESLRDHANSVFEIYSTMLTIKMNESSNQLNFVMQRLTIAATIFMPLTFIVGIYGMNFDYMPEFRWKGFYYLLWGLMVVLVGGMLYFFKKKKWI